MIDAQWSKFKQIPRQKLEPAQDVEEICSDYHKAALQRFQAEQWLQIFAESSHQQTFHDSLRCGFVLSNFEKHLFGEIESYKLMSNDF